MIEGFGKTFNMYSCVSHNYSTSDSSEESVSVCLSVSMNISSELHVRSSPGFLYMLPMAVVWPSFGGVVICYIFPVLWMISYLHNAHKLRLSSVDVAARLRQRGSHTAMGLACVWHPLQAADTWENVSWCQHQGGVCGV